MIRSESDCEFLGFTCKNKATRTSRGKKTDLYDDDHVKKGHMFSLKLVRKSKNGNLSREFDTDLA